MGGFEGGDEAGFWDIDTLAAFIDKQDGQNSKHASRIRSIIETDDSSYRIKAHAKVNVFFKITGKDKDGFPTLLSRFVRVDELYDTISFEPCECEGFTIQGCDDIILESNTIYKAYKALLEYTADSDIADFFAEHKVVVTKGIPLRAGLCGAASDAAAFMHLLKEVCNLVLSTDELAKIGRTIGVEVPFFIHDYASANVSGSGDIIEPFDEGPLKIEVHTAEIECDRDLLFRTWKKHLSATADLASFSLWQKEDSKSIVETISDPLLLNDLYAAALSACPSLKKEASKGWFFSGPGPTFFRLLD